jgi:hypothetical protein
MSAHRAARPEPDPTPVPSSNVRPAMSPEEAFALALDEMDLRASREAAKLYGDDELVELEAIAAGMHPKQRKLDAREIDDTKRQATEALAQIRAKLGT